MLRELVQKRIQGGQIARPGIVANTWVALTDRCEASSWDLPSKMEVAVQR
jgi:hypothetical protein